MGLIESAEESHCLKNSLGKLRVSAKIHENHKIFLSLNFFAYGMVQNYL